MVGVPDLHLLDELVVLRRGRTCDLDVRIRKLEATGAAIAGRGGPGEPQLVADARRTDDPVVFADPVAESGALDTTSLSSSPRPVHHVALAPRVVRVAALRREDAHRRVVDVRAQ